jgi:ketosteroid isomerase-like protein
LGEHDERICANGFRDCGRCKLHRAAAGKRQQPRRGGHQALESEFNKAFNAKDVDAIMKVYVPDESLLVFDVVPPRQYAGAKAYRKDWEDFLATFKGPVKLELSDLHVFANGTIGYGSSIQHVSGADTKGQPFDITVRVTDGYRKVNGHWLIAHEHVSVPVDLDSGKPDLTSKP